MPTLRDKKAQIERLVEIGQGRFGTDFGWKAKFARALKMSPQQLNDYLSGRISIGAEMEARLRGIEADVEYIMSGKKSTITVTSDKDGIHFSKDTPESLKKKIRALVRDVEDLKDPDVDKIRDLVRTIFGTKKK